jgi:sugar phosphate isomerase/epimerase
MIFISTGGRRDQSAINTAFQFYSHGIHHVELSGGAHSEQFLTDLESAPDDLILQIHNYFPPPATPFVFNLASEALDVSELSIKLARNAISIASGLNRSIYSFHAGFRINPRAKDLGRKLVARELVSRTIALEIFIERVLMLAKEAESLGVRLMIENNVITRFNFNSFGEDPLLLTCPDEIEAIMKMMPKNVGLLLDVAHLKVSSNTLDFDLIDAHERLKPWIQAYHLSDNNGDVDSNEPVTPVSWFWKYLVRDLDSYTLEVYGVSVQELYAQQLLTKKMLAGNIFNYQK